MVARLLAYSTEVNRGALSLENVEAFTLMAQCTTDPDLDTVTFTVYGRLMQVGYTTDIEPLQELVGSTDDLSEYEEGDLWVIISGPTTVAAADLGPGKAGWSLSDSGRAYKAVKVKVEQSGTQSSTCSLTVTCSTTPVAR